MPKTSLSAIHTELQRVQGDLANAREIVNSERGDYTEEGAQKAYLNRIQHYNTASQLETARNQVEQVRAGALKKAADYRESIFPTASDATEQLAAELAVSRMMQRPSFDSKAALAAFDEMPASATRTLLINESVARGLVSQEAIDGHTLNNYPEYKAAKEDADKVQAVSHSVDAKINYLQRAGEQLDAPKPGATESVDVSQLPGADLEF